MELSLYEIESQLAVLVDMREETAAELAAVAPDQTDLIAEKTAGLLALDEAIREYIRTEIRKVDGIRAFWRHCDLMRTAAKSEAETQMRRAELWGARLDRLKDMCKAVMESMPWQEGKPRRLEGRTGSISLKTNGGKQGVEIANEALIPDEYREVTVIFRADQWRTVKEILMGYVEDQEDRAIVFRDKPAVPVLSLIGEALLKPCQACHGKGSYPITGGDTLTCSHCGGSGFDGVPGARLATRKEHVECK